MNFIQKTRTVVLLPICALVLLGGYMIDGGKSKPNIHTDSTYEYNEVVKPDVENHEVSNNPTYNDMVNDLNRYKTNNVPNIISYESCDQYGNNCVHVIQNTSPPSEDSSSGYIYTNNGNTIRYTKHGNDIFIR